MNEWKVSAIGSWYFIGWCTTLIWLPALADKYGRKYLLWAGLITITICYAIMLFTESLLVMSIVIFIQGMVTSLRVNVGYVYMMELMPRSVQTQMTTFWCSIDALIYLFASVYFWKISKDAKYFELVGLIWVTISCILIYWLPESPRYLVSTGNLERAEAVFKYIARWNGKQLSWDP